MIEEELIARAIYMRNNYLFKDHEICKKACMDEVDDVIKNSNVNEKFFKGIKNELNLLFNELAPDRT